MPGKIAMLFAEGFEEAEAVIVADVLRRLHFEVEFLAADNRQETTGSHGITIRTERTLASACPENYAAVVLPGGMPGSSNLRDNPAVITFLQAVHQGGGVVAAICAAPIVLAKAGLLEHCRFTACPGFESEFGARKPSGHPTERGNRVVTGRGPGAAFRFAAEVAAILGRGEDADRLFETMQVER